MYKKHEAGLFFKRGEVQINEQALITLEMLIQTKPEGIGFSEVDFCIGGKRGSFDRKYDVVFYTGIQCIHRFSPCLCLGETNTEHLINLLPDKLQCFGQ